MPRGKTIVHATLDPMDLNKDVEAQYALIGDAKLTLDALRESMADRSRDKAEDRRGKVSSKIAKIKAEWLREWDQKRLNNETPINPYRVLQELHNGVDIDNTIITHDAVVRVTSSLLFGIPPPHSPISVGERLHSLVTDWV